MLFEFVVLLGKFVYIYRWETQNRDTLSERKDVVLRKTKEQFDVDEARMFGINRDPNASARVYVC